MINKLSNKLAKHYLIYSLVISIALFSICMLFTAKVKFFPLGFHVFLETSSLSILIGYLLAAIKYLVTNIKPTLAKLKPLFKDAQFQTYSDFLDKEIRKSKIGYIVILLIVIPFMLLEFSRFLSWRISVGPTPTYFYLFEPSNQWALALDIYNHIIGYLALFLLAIIVWRVINLIEIVNALDSDTSISVDIFHVDDMGGLRPLRNFILIVISNYFIILTLAIISYISPAAIISYEMIFLIIMLLLGVILFAITLKTVRNMINRGLKRELGKINAEYKKNYNRSITIISDNEPEFNREELKELSLILDILEKERTKIKQLGRRRYEFSTVIAFIGSFLLPTITLIEKMYLYS
jgi:ABC-type multidrug transport system fused ATPase/permease subunit